MCRLHQSFFQQIQASVLGQELRLTPQPRCVPGAFPPEGKGTVQRHGLGMGASRSEKERGCRIVTSPRVVEGLHMPVAQIFSPHGSPDMGTMVPCSDTETGAESRPVSATACALTRAGQGKSDISNVPVFAWFLFYSFAFLFDNA